VFGSVADKDIDSTKEKKRTTAPPAGERLYLKMALDTKRATHKNKPPRLTKPPKPPTAKQELILAIQTKQPTITRRALAKQANTSFNYVQEVLQRYGLTKQTIDDFNQNKSDVLAGLQHRLLSNITQQEIEKAPLGSKILAACQLYDKQRLQDGQSTSNINYFDVSKKLEELKAQKEKLLANIRENDMESYQQEDTLASA
jgi:hypothetical protein